MNQILDMYKILKEQLDKHLEIEDMARKTIIEKIENLRDNHIHHLALDIGSLKKDLWWVKLIGGFIIGQAVVILIALFIK